MIKDLKDTSNASGLYLLKDVAKCVTNNGKPYFNLHLQDSSGVIDAKKWDVSDKDSEILIPGKIIRVDGEALEYRGKMQIKVLNVFEVNEDEADLSDFLMDSPIPSDILVTKFRKYVKSVKNPDCKAILEDIFARYYKDFIIYPAAVKNHHEFYHGLLYHTVSMCEIAEFLASHYQDVDYDILISGCLLHDLGKIIELSGPIATKYTDEGFLLGHLTIGMSIIRETAERLKITSDIPLLLEHMVISHHGKLEFGSAVLPSTREALLLSMIDDMDAKMMVLDKAYNGVEPGNLTERIPALDNRSFYKKKLKK